MQNFIDSYCQCDVDSKQKRKHIIEIHARTILENTLQPVFKRQVQIHPTLSKRPEPKYRPSQEVDLHENQQWKQGNSVELLSLLVEELPAQDLEVNLDLIIPPTLIVLDDYDIFYKEQGIKMVHTIVKNLESGYISRFGLDKVFFESVFKCLSYLSQERDIPLLSASFPCIIDLIESIRDEKTRIALYERVLTDSIFTGYLHAGQKIKFLVIILQPISIIYEGIGAIGIQYLKAILPILCDAMAMSSTSNPDIKKISELSAVSLCTVIKICWPRIPAYKGLILKALAKSWSRYYQNNDTHMCEKLKEVWSLLEAACNGQEKNDKEALLSYNSRVYGPLFSTV